MTKNGKNGLRGQILKAARKLLIKDGIQNVSMRKIAAEIGCKAPSIYYHFRNKDQLIHTLIDEGHHRLYQHLLEIQEEQGEEASILKKVEANIRGFLQFGLENPEFYEIMYLSYSEEIARYPRESFRKTRQTLELSASLYKEAMDAGLADQSDPYVAATTVNTMLNGYIANVLMHRMDTRFDPELLQDDLVRRILRGLGASLEFVEEEAVAAV